MSVLSTTYKLGIPRKDGSRDIFIEHALDTGRPWVTYGHLKKDEDVEARLAANAAYAEEQCALMKEREAVQVEEQEVKESIDAKLLQLDEKTLKEAGFTEKELAAFKPLDMTDAIASPEDDKSEVRR